MQLKDSLHIFSQQLAHWYNPESVFVSLFGKEQYLFWLDSSKGEKGFSRFSYMGDVTGSLSKRIYYSVADNKLKIIEKGKTEIISKSIFTYLEEQLQHNSKRHATLVSTSSQKSGKLTDFIPFYFTGGFVGYFGYELQNECGGNTPYESNLPDACFFFIH